MTQITPCIITQSDCQQSKSRRLTHGDKATKFFPSKFANRDHQKKKTEKKSTDGPTRKTTDLMITEALSFTLFNGETVDDQFPQITCKRILIENAKIEFDKTFEIGELKIALFKLNQQLLPITRKEKILLCQAV